MESKKRGRQTVALAHPPTVAGFASVVGKKEGDGPLAETFDLVNHDDTFGEKIWEKAESAMQRLALSTALDKAGLPASRLDYILAGDLLNQCIGTGFAVRGQDVPFYGLYGACSTMAESLSLAALLLDGAFGDYAAAMTTSHFLRRPAHPHRPVDGDGLGLCDPVPGGDGPTGDPRDHGEDRGQGHQGRQQHGGGHGPGGL